MKTLKANPGARRLIESLRDLGYEFTTAVADIVDNSIAANASEVDIDIYPRQNGRPAAIVIADNGNGMGRTELHEAMRFGAFQEYSTDDLGKFGLGLKTASLSQCKTLTVCSKEKSHRGVRSRRQCMRWDIDHVYKTDDWDLLEPSSDDFEEWEAGFLENLIAEKNGTVILWSNLDEELSLLSAEDIHDREKFLAHLLDELRGHLRMVFHRFMQGSVTGRHKLIIKICGEVLQPWDPFCRNEKTREMEILKLRAGTDSVVISPFVLPREDEFSSNAAWKDASGPRNWNQQQGFYFYRNNRLLQSGGWSNMRAPDEHTKLLRIAIDFPSTLDRRFSINITKMKARIPAELRKNLMSEVSSWSGTAGRRYRGASAGKSGIVRRASIPPTAVPSRKGVEVITPSVTVGPVVLFQDHKTSGPLKLVKNKKTSQVEISIPSGHFLSDVFRTKDNYEGELKRMLIIAMALLEAVHLKKIKSGQIPMEALGKVFKRNI